jgi:hypothetical protein
VTRDKYDVSYDAGAEVPFGIDRKKMAEVLRKIADSIDAGEIVGIDKFTVLSLARYDEFARIFIRFAFSEKIRSLEQKGQS